MAHGCAVNLFLPIVGFEFAVILQCISIFQIHVLEILCTHDFLLEFHKFISIHHFGGIVHQSYRETSVVGDGRFSRFAFFRSDDNYTISTTRTIDGGGGSIFQNVNGFDVIRV